MSRTVLGKVLQVSLLIGIAIGVEGQSSKNKSSLPLEGTQWKLIWLGGTKIEAGSPQQMPYIELDADNHRVAGSGGCNRLMGGYQVEGAHLRFTQMAMSRMMCLHGNETEANFSKALDQVREWKVVGGRLFLMDANHRVVAKFSAAPAESKPGS